MQNSLRNVGTWLGVLIVSIPMLAGCASGGKGKATKQGGTAPAKAESVRRLSDPVAASALRERALELLSSMSDDPAPQVRGNVIEAMAVTPGRLEPFLIKGLRDENLGVRATAAVVVGKANLRNLSAALRPLLKDSSDFVRASAIFGLAKCGEDVDRSPLASLLLSDPSVRVRSQVAFLLGELGDKSALGLLHEAARISMPRAGTAEMRLLQLQLAEAMVKLGEDDQIATIRAALYPSRPEDLEATALAVQIIGQVKDRGSIDELIYLSARNDEQGHKMPAEVRLGVAAALARMGLKEGGFIADEYAANTFPPIRAQVAFVYGEIGRPESLAKLEEFMADPDPMVRVAAAAGVLKCTAAAGMKLAG